LLLEGDSGHFLSTNPFTGTPLPASNFGRGGHVAGSFLIFDGEDVFFSYIIWGGGQKSVEVFELSENRWYLVENSTERSPDPVYGAAYAMAGPDSILIFGGSWNDVENNNLWVLNVKDLVQGNDFVTQLNPDNKPEGRWLATLVSGDDGNFFLFGGESDNGDDLQDLWRYSMGDNTWTQLAMGPTARSGHISWYWNQNVYVTLGHTVDYGDIWRYTVEWGNWSRMFAEEHKAVPAIKSGGSFAVPVWPPVDDWMMSSYKSIRYGLLASGASAHGVSGDVWYLKVDNVDNSEDVCCSTEWGRHICFPGWEFSKHYTCVRVGEHDSGNHKSTCQGRACDLREWQVQYIRSIHDQVLAGNRTGYIPCHGLPLVGHDYASNVTFTCEVTESAFPAA